MSVDVISYLELTTGVGLILFWLAFFAIGLAPKNPAPGYFEFEKSFPLPDGILAVGLLLAGYGLLTEAEYAVSLSLVCAGGLMFLGVVDLSFGIQNSFKLQTPRELFFSLFINGWCVFLGCLIFWKLG